MSEPEIILDKLIFELGPDRGYSCRAHYLIRPKDEALVEVLKDGNPLRCFRFPAYKIWNIAAHFSDIVDSELAGESGGYQMAAWDGIQGAIVLLPKEAP